MFDKELLGYIHGSRRYLVLWTIVAFLATVLGIGGLILLVLSIWYFALGENREGWLFILYALLSGIGFAFSSYLASHQKMVLRESIAIKVRFDSYEKYLALEGKSFLSRKDMLDLSLRGSESISRYYASYLPALLFSLLYPVILFVLLCFFSWPTALVYLLLAPGIPLVSYFFEKKKDKALALVRSKTEPAKLSAEGAFSGMRELMDNSYLRTYEKEWEKKEEEGEKARLHASLWDWLEEAIVDLIAYLGSAIGLLILILTYSNAGFDRYQSFAPYLCLFLVLLGASFFLPLRHTSFLYPESRKEIAYGKKLLNLLAEENPEDGDSISPRIDSVRIEDVSFLYPQSETDTLSGLKMKFNKGLYAVYGKEGSGKSTLVRVLYRDLPGFKGLIFVDDVSLMALSKKSYRNHIAVLSPKTEMLSLSLKDSFLFYNPDLKEEEMNHFIAEVELSDFVKKKGGLNYCPYEEGKNLPYGIRMRLLLAYYLSSPKDFMIFDGILDEVDQDSALIMLRAIQDFAKDHVTLLLTRKMNPAFQADYLYCLEEGKILKEGKPQELLEKDKDLLQALREEKGAIKA